MAERSRLDRLLRPESVAVIGASANPDSISGRPVRFLLEHGYQGRIYPVNPKYENVQGLTAFPDIGAVPEPVDLAVIAVPAASVPAVVAACAAAGTGSAVVFSSGFAEGTGAGAELEAQLRAIASGTGLRLVGPNSEGFINLRGPVPAGFSPSIDYRRSLRRLIVGDVAVLSQSGGLGFALLHEGLSRGLGFSAVVSTGNEADLETLDFLEHLLDDGGTRVVLMFLEGFRQAARFPPLAERAARLGKPLVVAKVGRSAAGERAAASHTAHLAGRDAAYQAVFRQWGVAQAMDQHEAVDIALALSWAPLPAGGRAVIVTYSGGAGAWTADAVEAEGLEVPVLSADLQRRIARLIPAYGSPANPVDVTAQVINTAGGAVPVLAQLLASPEVDLLILVMNLASPDSIEREGEELLEMLAASAKPILVHTYTRPAAESVELLAGLRLPWFPTTRRTARAARALVEYAAFRRRLGPGDEDPRPPAPPGEARLTAGRPGLTEHRAKELLRRWGFRTPEGRLAAGPEQAGAAAAALGGPVALKLQAASLVHKSEAGGVALGLVGEEAVSRRAAEMLAGLPGLLIEGFLVERMAAPGVEMILGALNDADFGPLVMVGTGGAHAELLADRAFAPAPVTAATARDLVAGLRGASLLAAAGSRPAADVEALAQALVRLSQLAAAAAAEIGEIDLNPVVVHPAGQGVTVVDAAVLALPAPAETPAGQTGC